MLRTPTNAPGVLVAVEGIDGAGKTTQVRRLERWLEERDVAFISTKEPTQGPWGQKIRESARLGRLSPSDELQAFLADRRQHVSELLLPSLAEGKVVIVDRYYFSTVAYQGARGMDPAEILLANAFAPAPDVLVVIDVPPLTGLRRIRERGDQADLFEKEDELARARDIFLGLQAAFMTIVDGSAHIDDIESTIRELVRVALRHAQPGNSLLET